MKIDLSFLKQKKDPKPKDPKEKDNGPKTNKIAEYIKAKKKAKHDAKLKTYVVTSIENPSDYDYIDAIDEKEAIKFAPYIDKDIVRVFEKPQYNCYVIDGVNGSGREFVEYKELFEQVPDVKLFNFGEYDQYLYYLYREYNDTRTEYKLIPFTRPTDAKVTPDILFNAISWDNDLNAVMYSKSEQTVETIRNGVLIALVGILALLVIILLDM